MVYKDNWPQPNATFCDGLAGPKYLVSQSHSCALFPGCGISFCDGFVNSAKPLLANRHTKFALEVEFPPCGFFLRGSECHDWIGSLRCIANPSCARTSTQRELIQGEY